jgi:prephenate dehydrogenase
MFNRVCIVGIGLIGGSFGLALKKRGLAKEVIGVARRQSTLDEAVAMGTCDHSTSDVVEAATDADLVFLSPPVGQMKAICEQIAPVVAPGAIVTDAGSTKGQIVSQCEPVFMSRARFLGGHPMAGSEKTGATAAREDLYQNAVWILTPTEQTDAAALQTMESLVASLGAQPIVLDASTHDELLAVTSHLPHITAAALTHVFSIARAKNEATSSLVAGGWRDCTRIAAGSPEMWRDICLANRSAILQALEDLSLEINRFRAALSHDSGEALGQWFEEAAHERTSMNGTQ